MLKKRPYQVTSIYGILISYYLHYNNFYTETIIISYMLYWYSYYIIFNKHLIDDQNTKKYKYAIQIKIKILRPLKYFTKHIIILLYSS